MRERTVLQLSLLFLFLVLVSAYLGWSATTTVNAIYLKTVELLTSQGAAIPTNPVLDTSPLALLRNMATYVSLIGALSAIVLGHQMVATDRKSGVMPLLGSRPLSRKVLGSAKVVALTIAVAGLIGTAALINTATFLFLPEFRLDAGGWAKLVEFYAASGLYILAFGLLGLIFAARARSESVALLVPVTIWLTVTFVLPQLTSNINPVAALNPVSALALPPGSSFFNLTGAWLTPISLAEAYRAISATLLDFVPADFVYRGIVGPGISLVVADAALAAIAILSIAKIDMTQGDYNE
jgi:ABC-type transport system involved in multi-copper enzyme maturation permease subunit